jgi:hypothetical protein
MVTAGALSNLNQTLGFNGQSGPGASGTNGITTTQAANQFTSNLLKNVTNNVAGAAIDSAINGKALDEKSLASALSSALITAGMAQGANAIGDADLNSFANKLAHAALGCAGGAAISGTSGGSGCRAGAVGAVVGELAADYYMDNRLDASKTFEQNIQSAKDFAKVMAAVSGVISGSGGDNVAAVNIANTAGGNAVENNYFSRSPFPKVRTAVAKENARLTAECGANCTQEDFRRIDQQAAKLERALNLVEVAQRGKLNQGDAVSLTQLVMEIAPGTGTLESLAQLITGKQTLTGDETSRLWAAIGVIPFGGVLKPLGRTVGDLASVLSKDADIIAKRVGSGANGGTKIADVGLEIPPGKFDYLFGRSVSNEHNAARSNQLALEMKRLGVPDTPSGQQMLSEHLTQSVKAEGNVVNTFSNQYGTFEVRESLFMGPSGKAANLQSTFQIFPDGTRRLSTVIPRH